MFVLGTAGHIDHGKSALVQALTGIDPDRLREEKERGMTIDLGFAWLKLPGGQEVGIVDVPGHERFVKNMLAGVGSIDLALLIVAANEGVMPQTREHLAILDLLSIERGIVVITKKDLVDQEWLDLVKMDIEELIRPTTFSQAPIIAVSAVTREGLPELVATIEELLSSTEPKKDIGRPRLPIDRIFTIAGAGTIVTGTLIDGSLTVGQEVEIVPPGLKSRLRGLQTHKARLSTVTPGSRVAANLVGLATSDIQRGDVLTRPGWLVPTTQLSVELRLLAYLRRPLRHNATVSFHTGAAETMAKVRLLEKERLEPGETGWAQLVLDRPVALVKGDHFIIRSPMETLGGGKIVDSHAKRLRRFRPALIESLKVKEKGTAEDVILTLLEARQPLDIPSLIREADLPESEARPAVESLIQQKKVIQIGQARLPEFRPAGQSSGGTAGRRDGGQARLPEFRRDGGQAENGLLFTAAGWQRLTQEATAILQEYHRRFPARLGMPRVELASRLKLSRQSAAVMERLVVDGVLNEEGLVVRLPSHRVQLTPAQQAKVDAFLKSLAQNPYSPPTDQLPEPDLLNLLIERRQVVKVSESVVFSSSAYDKMVERVLAHIKANGKITLAEVRDIFQTSRKYAQALIEYLDEKKITRRVGDERVMY